MPHGMTSYGKWPRRIPREKIWQREPCIAGDSRIKVVDVAVAASSEVESAAIREVQ